MVAEWYHPATTMPNVTLRLTDEQHRLLSEDAERNSRSLQKEIVHRLFRWPTVSETLSERGGVERRQSEAALPRSDSAEVRTDFKKGKK